MSIGRRLRAVGFILAALFVSGAVVAQEDVTLTCNAPTVNTDGTPLTDLTGYNVYRGDAPGAYLEQRAFGPDACAFVWTDAPAGTSYFVATALKSNGTESDYSNEAVRVVAAQPVELPAPVDSLTAVAVASPEGGEGMALDDTGLVARYYADEAASGQGPTELLDSSGLTPAMNLPISYGTNLAYTEISGNRGLESTSNTGNGIAELAASANTRLNALDGATQLTLEYVLRLDAGNDLGGRVFGLMNGPSGNGTMLTTVGDPLGSSSNAEMRQNGNVLGTNISYTAGRHVFHMVFDGSLPDTGGRMKFYIDGVRVDSSPTGVDASLSFSNTRLVVLNRSNLSRPIDGVFHYGAIYTDAFSQTRIDDHYAVLSADDDTPVGGPSAAGTATLPAATASGSAQARRVATGAATVPSASASGAAAPRRQATGAATAPSVTASGAAAPRRQASGAATLATMQAAGTATNVKQSSGAATAPGMTAAGAAVPRRQASGAATLPASTAVGTASVTRKATGAASIPAATASGAASRGVLASGSAALPAFTASGTASPGGGAGETASGAATLPGAVASGAASVGHAASGAAVLPLPTTAGTANARRTASGAASLPVLSAAGAAVVGRSASGAATLPGFEASGVSSNNATASGAATLPAPAAAGAAVVGRSASGAATLPAPVAEGTGQTTAQASGAAALPGMVASGAASVRRTASGSATLGALQGSGIVIVGGATVLGEETLVGCVVDDTIAGLWTVDEDIAGTL